MDDLFKSAAVPEGEYAIVELLGHRTLVGRIAEVERFGTKMIQIEPVFQGRLLPALLHGGSAIYGITPCSRELAADKGPKNDWQLPDAVRAQLPKPALPAPEEIDMADCADPEPSEDDDDDDDDEGPF